jgi:tol-pal system protein YbgF
MRMIVQRGFISRFMAFLSRRAGGVILAVLSAGLVAACGAGRVGSIEERQMTLQGDYKTLSDELNDTRARLADTRASMEDMRRQVNTLNGLLEEKSNRTKPEGAVMGAEQLEELYTRVARIEEELKAQATLLQVREEELRLLRDAVLQTGKGSRKTTASRQPTSTGGAANTDSPGSVAESAAVREEYEGAWRLLQGKDYRGAIAQFKRFLRKYPTSSFADNAQYWVGESYYALKEFDQAILEFDVVRRKYPNGDKVPAALLKQGYAFAELGDRVDARLILQEVIDRYPKSTEAQKAKSKVDSLGS